MIRSGSIYTKTTLGTAIELALLSALAFPAAAHHNSGALFDLDRETTIQGTVTRFDWRNPHVYVHVESPGEDGEVVAWRLEGGPLALMRRLGWSRDTLSTGERVTITVAPSRNPEKRSGLLRAIEASGRELPPVSGDAAGRIFGSDDFSPPSRADGLSGTWVTLVDDELLEGFNDPTELTLTGAGAEAVASFDELTDHPGLQCVPYTAPLLMLVPDTKSIDIRDDIGWIRGEFDGTERTIYFDGRDAAEPTIHGHSIGRWENGALVIETSAFADHRMGNAFSLPSGSRKRLLERLEPNADGTALTYRFELSDPEFLALPVTGETTWAYRPDIEFSLTECDVDNARQYLDD